MARKVGRPTKYGPAVVKTILGAIRAGETYRGAALAAGISERTFHEWRELYPQFSQSLTRAESEMRRRALARIEAAAASGNVNASMWILERRFPHEFGRRALEVSGPSGGPIPLVSKSWTDYKFLTDDKARDAAATLIEALAAAEVVASAESIARDARDDRDERPGGDEAS